MDTAARTRDKAFTSIFTLIATAIACSIVLVAAPRAVEPERLPALRLPDADVRAQRARDAQLAARAPRAADDVARFLALYAAAGRGEVDLRIKLEDLTKIREKLAASAGEVFERVGEEGRLALIASLTERALTSLRSGEDSDDARGLLGAFPRVLARSGYADARGRLLAPELAVRALYKTRLNLVCGRPLERDLSPIEREAYEGWNALEAGGLAPERRALAARAFAEAGGIHGTEARAIWLFQGGARRAAGELLRREYERTGALRLRNMALFAFASQP